MNADCTADATGTGQCAPITKHQYVDGEMVLVVTDYYCAGKWPNGNKCVQRASIGGV